MDARIGIVRLKSGPAFWLKPTIERSDWGTGDSGNPCLKTVSLVKYGDLDTLPGGSKVKLPQLGTPSIRVA